MVSLYYFDREAMTKEKLSCNSKELKNSGFNDFSFLCTSKRCWAAVAPNWRGYSTVYLKVSWHAIWYCSLIGWKTKKPYMASYVQYSQLCSFCRLCLCRALDTLQLFFGFPHVAWGSLRCIFLSLWEYWSTSSLIEVRSVRICELHVKIIITEGMKQCGCNCVVAEMVILLNFDNRMW